MPPVGTRREEFPRELYKKAAEVGLLQLGYPEEYGGIACDRFYNIIASQELTRAGSGGVSASLMSHTIVHAPFGSVRHRGIEGAGAAAGLGGGKRSPPWRSPNHRAARTWRG